MTEGGLVLAAARTALVMCIVVGHLEDRETLTLLSDARDPGVAKEAFFL